MDRMLAGLVLGLGLALTGGSPSALMAAADPTASPLGPSPLPITDVLEATIPVEGSPDWPTVAFDAVWVLAPDLPLHGEATPQLVRIDPATNAVAAAFVLPDRLCQGFTATDDTIWACAKDALIGVDPASGSIVDQVPITGATGAYRLATADGEVWALGSSGFNADTLVRLDPATGTITAYPIGGTAGGIAAGLGAIWATIPDQGTLVRLDPATGALTTVATGLPAPAQIVAGEEELWVTLFGEPISLYPSEGGATPGPEDPQVARIRPDGTVAAWLRVGGSPRGGVDLALDGADLLVRSTRPWLARVDAASDTVVASVVSEPDVPAVNGPLAVGFGSIWTVNIEAAAVYRLTP